MNLIGCNSCNSEPKKRTQMFAFPCPRPFRTRVLQKSVSPAIACYCLPFFTFKCFPFPRPYKQKFFYNGISNEISWHSRSINLRLTTAGSKKFFVERHSHTSLSYPSLEYYQLHTVGISSETKHLSKFCDQGLLLFLSKPALHTMASLTAERNELL